MSVFEYLQIMFNSHYLCIHQLYTHNDYFAMLLSHIAGDKVYSICLCDKLLLIFLAIYLLQCR
jgi:hypothetical protein